MNEEALVAKHIAEWRRLEQLCMRASVRVGFLSNEETMEFVRLYKRASSDLALVRTRSTNQPLISYLNNLVGRAHASLYQSPPKRFRDGLKHSIASSAITFRRNKPFFWVAFCLFFGAMILSWGLVNSDRSYLSFFTGGMNDVFESWKTGKFEERSVGENIAMSFLYAGNNPFVSIITAAKGAASFGLLSVQALFQNGALLGALASEMQSVGKLFFLFSSISPHGVPELTGIIFAGAAGLKFGWALIVPGVYSRFDSLKRSAKDGVTLIVTGVLLCFVAAPIEGFFSFNPKIPQPVKMAFAIISLVGWILFWSFYAKDSESQAQFSDGLDDDLLILPEVSVR